MDTTVPNEGVMPGSDFDNKMVRETYGSRFGERFPEWLEKELHKKETREEKKYREDAVKRFREHSIRSTR